MKKMLTWVVMVGCISCACTKKSLESKTGKADTKAMQTNPLLSRYTTPFEVPPFDQIQTAHFMPAFVTGIEEHNQQIEAIADNSEPADFRNTIEALEFSGGLLSKVQAVFLNLLAAHTSDALQKVAKTVNPMLSKHEDDIVLNAKLFARIKSVHAQKEKLALTLEQARLLEKTYLDFIRGGAGLDSDKQVRLRKINQELSVLELEFDENILKETNRFKLVITDPADLSGLPDSVVQTAAESAAGNASDGQIQKKDQWVFTLHKPSLIPFLQYADNRELRKKMFLAYIQRGKHGDELDNQTIVLKTVALRLERARLLGYKTHADYVLEETMAKNPQQVYRLIQKLWKPSLQAAVDEANTLRAVIRKTGKKFELKPWDWWYYAEKVRKQLYDLDEDTLRAYFEVNRVRQGAFALANKLFGLRFIERTDIPKYHEDVRVFEVKEADGAHLGILYTDYHPRASKQGGAWMDLYRDQAKLPQKTTPIVCNVLNATKPTSDLPALLNLDEVMTLFHELGHALHGLLSDVHYERLSGTRVPRDFVELPSQIMENWAVEPEVLKMYARHYKTGASIPDELVEKIKKSMHFNQGFNTVEFLAASFLDMDWHTLEKPPTTDVETFEKSCFDGLGLIPEIESRYQSSNFLHIFAGGYSAGYYSYTWASVLDADAFEAFKQAGLFDTATAERFRKTILATGGTQDPMELYKMFRGREPRIDALLERKGFVQ